MVLLVAVKSLSVNEDRHNKATLAKSSVALISKIKAAQALICFVLSAMRESISRTRSALADVVEISVE